ncbi:MAG: hypothetical protein SFV32_04330 [Opitutaceae bacterium]|nr:hypothetical protein [Opitutaceae bacterium]
MIPASAETLPCPKCNRGRDALTFADDGSGQCRYCFTRVDILTFPAFEAARSVTRPRAVSVDSATCFYHGSNQAESICDDCGRFVCGVCGIPSGTSVLCPKCISQRQESDKAHIPSRFIYGGAVARLALLPLLMWPLTLVTAPTAVVLAIIGWRKPGSIVGGGRASLAVGGLIALVQCVLWGILIFNLVLQLTR